MLHQPDKALLLGTASLMAALLCAAMTERRRPFKRRHAPAYSHGVEKDQGGAFDIRPAGHESTRDDSGEHWSKVEEASDESFPASDPPGY
jgi:hypothetical protein